jgi:sugar O-acyltransferase (sialic acid O-acetyltransferase NeuD family)
MNEVVIIGGGGHAKICIDLIHRAGSFKMVGILDSRLAVGTNVLGVTVLGDDKLLGSLKKKGIQRVINGIGSVQNPIRRIEIYDRLKEFGFETPNIIHPSAVVEASVQMGTGNQIMAGAIVGSSTKLGNNCIVNYGAMLAHDCVLEDGVHICPGVQLSGDVQVARSAIIFTGAIVFPRVKIGEEAVVSAGAVVSQDVPSKSVVAGIPARSVGGMGVLK